MTLLKATDSNCGCGGRATTRVEAMGKEEEDDAEYSATVLVT